MSILLQNKKSGFLSALLLTVVLFALSASYIYAQLPTVWQKSQTLGTQPTWMGTNTERGFAYGVVGGSERIYVASTKGGINVIVLDAATGDSVNVLNTTGITGGTLALTDVEVSADGEIYACNLVTSASASTPFKIYKWVSESAAPVVITTVETGAIRLGDKFTVVGTAGDNSLTIYAAAGSGSKIVKLTTADNGATFTSEVIAVTSLSSGSTPGVAPMGTDLWLTGNGQPLIQINGTAITGKTPNDLLQTNSNAIKTFSYSGVNYAAVYMYGPSVSSTSSAAFWERAFIMNITGGYAAVENVGFSTFLGSNTNTNGTGDVSVRNNGDGTFTVFVLSTNNGLGAYTFNTATATATITPPYLNNFNEFHPSANWRRYTRILSDTAGALVAGTSGWFVDDFGNVTSPSDRSVRINIYGTIRKYWFVSPQIDLGDGSTDYQLEFDLALTGYANTNPATLGVDDKFAVIISPDNGVTWSAANTLNEWNSTTPISNTGEHVVINLGAYSGIVRLAFYGESTVSNADNDLFVDNFALNVAVPVVTADWNNLQWPPTATITEGETATAYAQIYEAGLTDVTVGGPAPGILSWIGISSADTDPSTWTTWVPATFNVEAGNNDEYMAAIGDGLTPGTYYYASRFQINYGPFTYGGYSAGGGGFWNGTTNVSGVLTVNPYIVSSFPFTEGFENVTFPPAGWAIEDLNAGNTWNRSTSAPNSGVASARYNYHSTIAADDWLFSPALTFTAGKTYSVTYYYKAQSATWTEAMNVFVGSAQNAAGMDSMLADHPVIGNTTYTSNTITYTAPSTGQYFLGLHCYSLADQWNLFVDDITVNEMQDNDYAVTSLDQVNGIPTPFRVSGVNSLMQKGVDPELTIVREGLTPVKATNVNNSVAVVNPMNIFNGNNIDALGGMVSFQALVTNMGLLSPLYQLKFWINGVVGTPLSPASGIAFGGTDTLDFGDIVTGRGTFTTVAAVVAAGDTTYSNDTLAYIRTLVYPDTTIRIRYDNGQHVPNTFIGFGSAPYTSITAGVRFTAAEDIQLANIDAFYRNESSSDSVLVTIWAAGVDTTAPGAVLYTQKFGGENYLVPGTGGDYFTLPLGDDAPAIMAGSDFWVSITFDSLITYPMGAHNSPLTTPGRSYVSDGTAWFPLIVTTERAWLLRVVGVPYVAPPVETTWERSVANENLPAWFSTANNERGIGHGKINVGTDKALEDRVFVVSRNGGLFVKMLDGLTGADLSDLNTTGVSGGLFALNDVEVSGDGQIFACNMTTNASTAAFKVYKWNSDSLSSAPVLVVDYTASEAVRLGDKFSVAFNFNDNSAAIFAASATAGIGKVYKWTMTAGSFNATPEIITLSDGAAGGSASVGPIWGGSFYWNAGGQSAKKYAADGTLLGTVPGTVVATGSNAIRFIGTVNGSEYFATYQYGGGNENARIVEVPNGDLTLAITYGLTTPLGTNTNVGGTGDVDIMVNPDGTAYIYVLSTNNGLGVYKSSAQIPVELEAFAATAEDRDVILNWKTATETNTSMFQVERSLTGNWEVVGSVRAAGTSTEKKEYSFMDKNLNSGKYQYRLKMVDLDGTYEYSNVTEVEIGVPVAFGLSQNYPNPFNPTTKVNYQIPVNSIVTIELYDITGQKVAQLFNNEQAAGFYTLDVSANKYRLASGVYIYRMIAVEKASGKNFVNTKKMMLLK